MITTTCLMAWMPLTDGDGTGGAAVVDELVAVDPVHAAPRRATARTETARRMRRSCHAVVRRP
jgi:hypothetical protein